MHFLNRINENEIHLHGIKRFTKYMLVFFLLSVIGWVYEEIYFLIVTHELVNRGFFYGPYLPVYGVGCILITFCIKRFKNKPLLFFILAMLITGVLEYLVGFALEKIWYKHLWDYSNEFLNINGFICFKSVISFALGGMILIYLIEPIINNFTNKIPKKKDIIINIIIPVILIIDFIFSVIYKHPL